MTTLNLEHEMDDLATVVDEIAGLAGESAREYQKACALLAETTLALQGIVEELDE
jgi:hypothetical protein